MREAAALHSIARHCKATAPFSTAHTRKGTVRKYGRPSIRPFDPITNELLSETSGVIGSKHSPTPQPHAHTHAHTRTHTHIHTHTHNYPTPHLPPHTTASSQSGTHLAGKRGAGEAHGLGPNGGADDLPAHGPRVFVELLGAAVHRPLVW